ncbi:MAG: 6-carboxytetrahydropterin synthase QueD [bacterium]
MYTIKKEFHFSAGHYLECLPDTHPCARQHGHNYIVVVELKSTKLNEAGFVRDYNDLKFVKDFLDDIVDHYNLNDIVDFNPTAENLAKWMYDTFKISLPELSAVEVSETPKTWARYER